MTQWLKDIKWEAYQYFSPRIWVCWDGWVCSWVEFHSSYWWCWTGVCSSWGPSRPRWPGASPCTLHWRSLHQVSLTQSHPTWKIVIHTLVRRGVLSVLPVEVSEGPLEGPAGGSPLAPVLWHAQSVLPLNIPLTPHSALLCNKSELEHLHKKRENKDGNVERLHFEYYLSLQCCCSIKSADRQAELSVLILWGQHSRLSQSGPHCTQCTP